MGTPYDPLSDVPPDIQPGSIQYLLVWLPLVSLQSRYYGSVRRQLKRLDPNVCADLWARLSVDPEVIKHVTDTLSDYLDWPRRRFIPDDWLRSNFWDHLGDLGTVEAAVNIEEAFRKIGRTDGFDEMCLSDVRLGQIVRRLSEAEATSVAF